MLSFGAIWFRGVHGRCLLYSFINSVGNQNSVSKLWSCRLAVNNIGIRASNWWNWCVLSEFVLSDLDYFRAFAYFYLFSSTFRRKKVELLSSLRRHRQRLGRLSFRLNFRLSFLSESISRNRSKVSIWNLEYLFTIKRGTNYNKASDPVICISRVICPCFDIVHRN